MMLVSDYVTMCSLATSVCSTVELDLINRTLEETVILPSLTPEVCLFGCICVCECVCACMHVYVGACVMYSMCVYVCTLVCVSVFAWVRACICMCVCLHACGCVCACVYMCWAHTCVCILVLGDNQILTTIMIAQ